MDGGGGLVFPVYSGLSGDLLLLLPHPLLFDRTFIGSSDSGVDQGVGGYSRRGSLPLWLLSSSPYMEEAQDFDSPSLSQLFR